MRRRDFLHLTVCGAAAGSTLFLPRFTRAAVDASATGQGRFDVVIAGGGLGGVAAALSALRSGLKVLMTEETDWIGGQLTQQGVPPDEHEWIESYGSTRWYRELRRDIREYYRRYYPLTEEARARWNLNPGSGGVSRLCHEPRVCLAVLESWLAPFIATRRLSLLLEHQVVAADIEHDQVRGVTVRSLRSGAKREVEAAYFIDATELGDLLPLTKTEFVTGCEGRAATGERHMPEKADPANQQAFTVCFAMDYVPDSDNTIEKPKEYNFWRDYVPPLTPPWSGKLLDLGSSHPHHLKPRRFAFDPTGATKSDQPNLWRYRRIASKDNFQIGTYAGDITLVNWPQNDYLLGNLIGVSDDDRLAHIARAKQLSLSLLYWLQTEAPRSDGKTGWRELRLRGDVLGTEDGLAKYPYIREARRIQAVTTIVEQDCGVEARALAIGQAESDVIAKAYPDSVGIGSYRIDLHPTTTGDNYIDFASLPFQIPLGSLVPVRVENLIPACKNIGTTHVTNGGYRLHPVEWNIGESAGLLIAFAKSRNTTPRAVHASVELRSAFQERLRAQGVEIQWPKGPF
ncbi:FAD-dependent oxidoreductase [Schlesneria paludicola]|uniref:FAD-dependent oxidoreductase n=1 Tax=Schlesneria paludicola TaxID=360056 RepID=UPI000299EB09|nr:FAD-dependent oxidoreductase [Schlesneria paludicola]